MHANLNLKNSAQRNSIASILCWVILIPSIAAVGYYYLVFYSQGVSSFESDYFVRLSDYSTKTVFGFLLESFRIIAPTVLLTTIFTALLSRFITEGLNRKVILYLSISIFCLTLFRFVQLLSHYDRIYF